MCLETPVGDPDQAPVKPFLIFSFFVSTTKQNRLAAVIECKRDPPYAVIGMKSKFLHIRVPGPIQGINGGPAQPRAELCKDFRPSKKFGFDGICELIKFGFEFVIEFHSPSHDENMPYDTYVFKYIIWNTENQGTGAFAQLISAESIESHDPARNAGMARNAQTGALIDQEHSADPQMPPGRTCNRHQSRGKPTPPNSPTFIVELMLITIGFVAAFATVVQRERFPD